MAEARLGAPAVDVVGEGVWVWRERWDDSCLSWG